MSVAKSKSDLLIKVIKYEMGGPSFMRDKMKAVTRAHTQDHHLIDLVLFSNISADSSLWFLPGLHYIL